MLAPPEEDVANTTYVGRESSLRCHIPVYSHVLAGEDGTPRLASSEDRTARLLGSVEVRSFSDKEGVRVTGTSGIVTSVRSTGEGVHLMDAEIPNG